MSMVLKLARANNDESVRSTQAETEKLITPVHPELGLVCLAFQPTVDMGFCFKPMSAADIIAHTPKELKWIWQDYIAEGDLALFTAYMKVGKSTFVYPLVLAVARGQDFLSRKTAQGGVLVLALEENMRDVQMRLKKLGITAADPVYCYSGYFPCDANALAQLEDFIKTHEIKLVVFDSLSAYWDISDENNNAEAVRKIKPVTDLAHRTGTAIILIHHESKFGGQDKKGNSRGDGKSIRGASSLFGQVDQALSLGKTEGNTPNRRVLGAIGRRSESPKKLIIELWGNTKLSDPASYGYKAIGTSDELDKVENLVKLFKVLDDTPKSIQELEAASDVKTGARKLLEELTAQGHAIREGSGKKGDPYTWRKKPLPAGPQAVPGASGIDVNLGTGGKISLPDFEDESEPTVH